MVDAGYLSRGTKKTGYPAVIGVQAMTKLRTVPYAAHLSYVGCPITFCYNDVSATDSIVISTMKSLIDMHMLEWDEKRDLLPYIDLLHAGTVPYTGTQSGGAFNSDVLEACPGWAAYFGNNVSASPTDAGYTYWYLNVLGDISSAVVTGRGVTSTWMGVNKMLGDILGFVPGAVGCINQSLEVGMPFPVGYMVTDGTDLATCPDPTEVFILLNDEINGWESFVDFSAAQSQTYLGTRHV